MYVCMYMYVNSPHCVYGEASFNSERLKAVDDDRLYRPVLRQIMFFYANIHLTTLNSLKDAASQYNGYCKQTNVLYTYQLLRHMLRACDINNWISALQRTASIYQFVWSNPAH